MNVYIREIAQALGEQGIAVDIFTRYQGGEERTVASLGKNVRLIHLKAGPEEPLPKKELYSYTYAFARELDGFRRLHRLNYQLIFSHYWLSGLVGVHLQDWWGVRHVTMFHTLALEKEGLAAEGEDAAQRQEEENKMVSRVDGIIAPTEGEKEVLVNRYQAPPSKVGVVPCGVNLDRFCPIPKGEARRYLGLGESPYALFVGRMEPEKGLDRLLEAWAHLTSSERPVLLVAGGEKDSSYREKMEKLSQEWGLTHKVIFLGSLHQEELPYYYNAVNVCVVPSYYESFGMVPLEAMACGVPVVATEVGGVKELVVPGVTGYLVASGEPQEMAACIKQAVEAGDRWDPYTIREKVLPYGWKRVADNLREELLKLGDSSYSKNEGHG